MIADRGSKHSDLSSTTVSTWKSPHHALTGQILPQSQSQPIFRGCAWKDGVHDALGICVQLSFSWQEDWRRLGDKSMTGRNRGQALRGQFDLLACHVSVAPSRWINAPTHKINHATWLHHIQAMHLRVPENTC